MISTLDFKLVVLAFLFVTSVVFGLLPYFLKRRAAKNGPSSPNSKISAFLDIANALSGGVIFCGGLLHLLPDSESRFEDYYGHDYTTMYPYAQLIAALAIFLIFFLERILVEMIADSAPDGEIPVYDIHAHGGHSHSHSHSHGHSHQTPKPTSNPDDQPEEEKVVPPTIAQRHQVELDTAVDIPRKLSDPSATRNLPHSPSEGVTIGGSSSPTSPYQTFEDPKTGLISVEKKILSKSEKAKRISGYAFLGSLCVHSLFEGLGVGTEDTLGLAAQVATTIVAHKLLAAFSLGMILTEAIPSLSRGSLAITLFSLMTPIGISIGILVSELVESQLMALVSACLIAVASGTFLYIGLCEILPLVSDRPFIKSKFAAYLVGFAAMAVLAMWV